MDCQCVNIMASTERLKRYFGNAELQTASAKQQSIGSYNGVLCYQFLFVSSTL